MARGHGPKTKGEVEVSRSASSRNSESPFGYEDVSSRVGRALRLAESRGWSESGSRGKEASHGHHPQVLTIYEAAPNFVMVNIEDDDDPHHPALEPDGAYYPRILFFGMLGCVLASSINDGNRPRNQPTYYADRFKPVDIPNPGRAAHKYYFPTVDVLIPAMYEAHRRVLEARESRAYEHDEV
ncbi:unnamed protein product [Darwinula stevensoni]|uniref:Uncharacterized protein n=1 Tax=Darwinula stevensoni TaxID=69355 RepID=A0A7R8WZR6_9CRUS|nr:unnamed protein product [Darwinula stevensoni]CAG0880868.1 unnamed protein product [Darwinula stevensoni]